ncbi:MAG: hypothetical protein LBR11_07160 [Deltaproteobacteria bacterium]|jgi:hypothetical protein|nr:hypothetical protein [Deltaproteobacteria bacterium]
MLEEMEALERVSQRFCLALDQIEDELRRSDDTNGLKLFPSVLLSISVIRLCQDLPAEVVLEMLAGLSSRVERGDFNQPEPTQPVVN